MTRFGWIGMLGIVAASVATSCGDDDDATGGGALDGKALESLTATDVKALCNELIGTVRDASSPERQCVDFALDGAATEAQCNTARSRCLNEERYVDYDEARCKTWTASTAPKFGCDTKVSEVKACYAEVADWYEGLRCSQAGDASDPPDCVVDLVSDCDLEFSELIGEGEAPEGDAGMSMVDSGMSSSGGDNQCRDGSKTLDYDVGLGADCNACATEFCCDSFVDCQNDDDCTCYWDCFSSGGDDCLETCNITDYPPEFGEHAVCLDDKCRVPCDL